MADRFDFWVALPLFESAIYGQEIAFGFTLAQSKAILKSFVFNSLGSMDHLARPIDSFTR